MRLIASFLAPLLLSACVQEPSAPAPASPSPTANTAPLPVPESSSAALSSGVATLAGAWRVAGIDGHDFNEPYALALGGSERELWWEPRCAGVARTYRIDGARIAFGPMIGAPKPGEMPPPVCAIGLPPRIAEVTRALDAATMIERTPTNGVLISGGGRSLLLFSQ